MERERKFIDWIHTYFILGLDCPYAVYQALFMPPRMIAGIQQAEQMKEYFWAEMIKALTAQTSNGWSRVTESQSSLAWARDREEVHSSKRCGFRTQSWGFCQSFKGYSQIIKLLECSGTTITPRWDLTHDIWLWGGHLHVQQEIEEFVDYMIKIKDPDETLRAFAYAV